MSLFRALVVAVSLQVAVSIALNVSSEQNSTTTSTTTIATTTFLRATTTRSHSAPGTTMLTTTSESVGEGGHCLGSDSRCGGKTQQMCNTLFRQGADCKWRWSSTCTSKGNRFGNDARCSGSNQAACTRLAAKGSHCWWEQADGPAGMCLGNDSRYNGIGKQICDRLGSEGADCKWRAAFSFTGYLLMEVSNATSFVIQPEVHDAVTLAIVNITGLPKEFISTYMDVEAGNQTRRLSTDGKVMLTYAGSVQGDAKPTPTGVDVFAALMSMDPEDFTLVLSNSVEELLGDRSFTVNVLDQSDVTLNMADSSEADTSTTVQVTTQMVTQIIVTENVRTPEDTDAAHLSAQLLAHTLAFVWLLHSL